MGDGIALTGEVLRQKWMVFADMVGVPDDERLNLSEGWLTSFKARHGLKDMCYDFSLVDLFLLQIPFASCWYIF